MNQFTLDIILFLIAAFGGMAKYLHQFIKTGVFKAWIFLAEVIVGAFSGMMFAKIAQHLEFDQNILWAMSGIGGALGWTGIQFLGSIIKVAITKKIE